MTPGSGLTLRVGSTDVIRIGLDKDGEIVGHVDVWTVLTEGADGKEDVTVGTATTVFGPLGPERPERLGFRAAMGKRPKKGTAGS